MASVGDGICYFNKCDVHSVMGKLLLNDRVKFYSADKLRGFYGLELLGSMAAERRSSLRRGLGPCGKPASRRGGIEPFLGQMILRAGICIVQPQLCNRDVGVEARSVFSAA
jgi:hypothetical protein